MIQAPLQQVITPQTAACNSSPQPRLSLAPGAIGRV